MCRSRSTGQANTPQAAHPQWSRLFSPRHSVVLPFVLILRSRRERGDPLDLLSPGPCQPSFRAAQRYSFSGVTDQERSGQVMVRTRNETRNGGTLVAALAARQP